MEAIATPTATSVSGIGTTLPASRRTPSMWCGSTRSWMKLGSTLWSSRPSTTSSTFSSATSGFFFFDHFDAIGVSRYLPVLVYVKGFPERAAYIGHPMESYEREFNGSGSRPSAAPRAWAPTESRPQSKRSRGLRRKVKRICVERVFLPADAESALRADCPRRSSSKRSFRSNAFARRRRPRSRNTWARRAIWLSISCSRPWPAPGPA